MTDKKNKLYFKILKKNQRMFEKVIGDRISDNYRQAIALYLTEIYFRSQHIIELIEKILETNQNCTKRDLDSLLGYLVYLQIEIYDELVDWFKSLKKPLKTVIDKVEDLWYEKPGTDTDMDIKTIRSSMKHIYNTIKKINHHSALKGSNKKKRRYLNNFKPK
jgi:hypothetical protein